MRTPVVLTTFALMTAAILNAQADQSLVTRLDQDKVTRQVVPDGVTFTIEVQNQLPSADYTRSIDVHEVEVAPIDLALSKPAATTPAKVALGATPCDGQAKIDLDA